MAKVYVSAVIDRPVDQVWATIRDFGDLAGWNPAFRESIIEGDLPADRAGCKRKLTLEDGAVIREELRAFSDEERSCTYSILESPFPIENYVSTLRLLPVTDGGRTFAEWSAEFDVPPENEEEICGVVANGVFQGGFDSLKNPV